jgi:cytochrome P450
VSASDTRGVQAFPAELDDPGAWLDPFDWYAEMRADDPVRYDPDREAWDLFRYEDVRRVLSADDRFSSNPRRASDFEEPDDDEAYVLDTMLLQDSPHHETLRGVVAGAFRPAAVETMAADVRAVADDLLATALDGDPPTLELVEALAYPLPVVVVADLLGVPQGDRERFKRWSDALVETPGRDEGGAWDRDSAGGRADESGRRGEGVDPRERGRAVEAEMASFFRERLDDRHDDPREDLLTTIARAEADDALSRREAVGTCILLLVAGNVTTTNLVTNAVRCLDESGTYDALADGRVPVRGVVEETLRYRSPVQAVTRVATESVTVGDHVVDAGEVVVGWVGAANRDPAAFDDPDEFDPGRSHQHLGFGHGTHYCLGAPLARLEARVALETLTDHLASVAVADADLRPIRSAFLYGVDALPLDYERAG